MGCRPKAFPSFVTSLTETVDDEDDVEGLPRRVPSRVGARLFDGCSGGSEGAYFDTDERTDGTTVGCLVSGGEGGSEKAGMGLALALAGRAMLSLFMARDKVDGTGVSEA